jgi:SAM-dependent methyltransferase
MHSAPLRSVAWALRAWWYGGNARECPVCGGHFRKFLRFGDPPRPDARCPRCGALERHRLMWLFLRERTALFRDPTRLLVVAPEPALQSRLARLSNLRYVSGDLDSRLARVRMDLERLPFRDGAFDAILCSHVLEHVNDARAALREMRRVLAPGGWAILQSPIDVRRAETYEDPRIVTPEQRREVFGQSDHVRIFGRDYRDWIERAGFHVEVSEFGRDRGLDWIARHGLDPTEDVYFCTPSRVSAAPNSPV